MAKIEIKAIVDKIVRQDGKAEAQMIVSIPVSASIDIPLGPVVMSIQTQQSAMFDAEAKVGKATKKTKE